MKTIIFYNQESAFPVPAIGGGAIEELEHILLDENEKNETYEFVFFQPEPTTEQKQKISTYHFKHTQLAFLKSGGRNLLWRALRKGFRYFNIYLKTGYDKNFIRELNNYHVDKIIFEGYCPISTLKTLSKKYGKQNLFFHIHSNYEPNPRIIKYVGHLVGVSEFVLKSWTAFYEKRHLIPIAHSILKNCVRSERFATKITLTERNAIREKLGFTVDDFIVVYCGRIIPEKGVLELMQAVCAINNKKIKLLIIGSPNFSRSRKSRYLTKVKRNTKAYTDKIVYTGYVPNEKLACYYQIADLHVVPSIWKEAAGLVVLEGQICGLPQIVTRAGGVVEYVNPETVVLDCNKNLVNNLSQQIIALSEDEIRRKKMISSGFENSRRYHEESYYKNFINLIENN